jgi:hypothetical protein
MSRGTSPNSVPTLAPSPSATGSPHTYEMARKDGGYAEYVLLTPDRLALPSPSIPSPRKIPPRSRFTARVPPWDNTLCKSNLAGLYTIAIAEKGLDYVSSLHVAEVLVNDRTGLEQTIRLIQKALGPKLNCNTRTTPSPKLGRCNSSPLQCMTGARSRRGCRGIRPILCTK